ncbi:cytochrome P450 94B3 [Ricinus communis]|uniref:Cytochrome P450, putative n=1 Tax=Ricinus communis TaxID=3988 RepID=B9RBJ0_RICCO|nr:cytochrome P450 94B3 [Ricinus communis]EEF50911.1 cytochrome P450, putative [Ricinus communis]|eukprot:XP_002509524.1 cytochrome P450 94B3 [Ricinus communis]
MATLMSLLTCQFLSFLLSLYMPFLYLFHVFLRKFRRVSGHGPPSYPIIGCLISFYKNQARLLDWYTQLLAASPTNTIVVNRLGARRTIVTANPENVEYMLKTNFNNFPKGEPFTEILGDFLGYGIFNVDGEIWHRQRKLASHEFSAKSLREFYMITLEEEVEKGLLPVLESLAARKEVVDLQELLRRLAFNMVCKVSLGIDRYSLDPSLPSPPLATAFDMASEICARRAAAPLFVVWKIKRWLGIGSERRLKDAVEQVHQYVGGIIAERKKVIEERGENDGEDFLSRLILAGHEENVIRDTMISFIMAGRDTTSAAMTWLFWLLSCHPGIEQEVVRETKFMTERKPDYDSLKELRLLKACLCESMRLYPPVAWDSKHAIVDDLLPDNTSVRAGDRVTFFPYGMGRMEALWGKDGLEFRPDRWFLEPEKRTSLRKVCPFKFPIFQAGPRVCLGKQMAFIQMKYVTASVLSKFEIRHVGSHKPVFVPRLTAHMAGGLKVVVRRRTEEDKYN